MPSAVWGALSDTGESFVRASALRVLAALSCRDQLWSNLLQTGRLTEVDVVKKIAGVLLEDDEAFPRRRAAACLVQWVKAQHPAIRTVLEPGGRTPRGERETNSAPPDAGHVTKGAEQLPDIVAVAICHACQDFDWEVKLLGIQFLEAVVDHFIVSGGNEVNAPSCRPAFSHTLGESPVPVPSKERCLCMLATMGAFRVVLGAVNDCDHMVCEAALLLLIKLKKFCFPEERSEGRAQTPEELQGCVSTRCEISLDQFREILKETNFTAALSSSTAADSSVRSDPVSFLEDILSAAADHEENLLDCY